MRIDNSISPALGGSALVNVADEGCFVTGLSLGLGVSVSAGIIVNADNLVRVAQIVIPYRILIRRIWFEVTTGQADALVDVGLYTPDGAIKLVSTGALDASSNGFPTKTLAAPYLINPGAYSFAFTSNNGTTLALRRISGDGSTAGILNAQSTKKIGNAANASVDGVLPATLGAISAVAVNHPIVVFSP